MMSSEEDADSFGLYGDKLLKKAKRARQRVDAGEPRNSYSSIPNFSSRPSLMSGGLYGAIYSQNQQHNNFNLFNSSYGTSTSKMLNELLARQVKQAQDAAGPETNMLLSPMEGASNSENSKHGFESNNLTNHSSSQILRRTNSVDMDDTSPQQNDLTSINSHMLRNMLQGKRELIALEQVSVRFWLNCFVHKSHEMEQIGKQKNKQNQNEWNNCDSEICEWSKWHDHNIFYFSFLFESFFYFWFSTPIFIVQKWSRYQPCVAYWVFDRVYLCLLVFIIFIIASITIYWISHFFAGNKSCCCHCCL